MTRKKQLKMFENTILNEEHTRRYTLGGVVGLEKQISNLSTVCLENSDIISYLQTQLRGTRELMRLAVEDMRGFVIYAKMQHHVHSEME